MSVNSMNDLIKEVDEFIRDRNWTQYHTPKNLAMSIAIEAAEIMELFQWLTNEEAFVKIKKDRSLKTALEDELADVMIYCLSMCNTCKIDITEAILEKLDRNKDRFPPEVVSGRLGPYEINRK